MMLKLDNVHTFYGQIEALKGVSLEVHPGEIVTLIGANGAGKSTLLMTICGSPQATKGHVIFEGQDITRKPTHVIMQCGLALVPEGRRIFPGLTVQENLQMGGFFADKARLETDLERVFTLFPRLKGRCAQRGGTLSGGEQQMLAIGRGLMAAPRVLLLDEPSLGLAPRLAEEIFVTLGELNKSGLSVLLVEQKAPLALQLAKRAYLLAVGRVVSEVTPDQIRSPHDLARYYLATH